MWIFEKKKSDQLKTFLLKLKRTKTEENFSPTKKARYWDNILLSTNFHLSLFLLSSFFIVFLFAIEVWIYGKSRLKAWVKVKFSYVSLLYIN